MVAQKFGGTDHSSECCRNQKVAMFHEAEVSCPQPLALASLKWPREDAFQQRAPLSSLQAPSEVKRQGKEPGCLGRDAWREGRG